MGPRFRSLTEHIDTTRPAGRMMMQLVGAFAEFERIMVRERTSASLAAARAEGRVALIVLILLGFGVMQAEGSGPTASCGSTTC